MRIRLSTRVPTLLLAAIATLVLVAPARAGGKDEEWVKGVTYTTDWKQAIKTARETGKMIFIYNGWKRSGI